MAMLLLAMRRLCMVAAAHAAALAAVALAAPVPPLGDAAEDVARLVDVDVDGSSLCLAERGARLLLRSRQRLRDLPLGLERAPLVAQSVYDPEANPATSAGLAAMAVPLVAGVVAPVTTTGAALDLSVPAPAPAMGSFLNITTTTLPPVAQTSIPPSERLGDAWQDYMNEMTYGRKSINATDSLDASEIVMPTTTVKAVGESVDSVVEDPALTTLGPTIAPAKEQPHEAELITMKITVVNVDYSLLTSSPTKLDQFTSTVRKAVAGASGKLIDATGVEMALFEGSVICQTMITNPSTVGADVLKETFDANVADVPAVIVKDLNEIVGFEDVTTGSIGAEVTAPLLQPKDDHYVDSFRDCMVGEWTAWGNCGQSTAPTRYWQEVRYRPVIRPHQLGGLPCLPQVMRRPCPAGGWSSAAARDAYAYGAGGVSGGVAGGASGGADAEHAGYYGPAVGADGRTTGLLPGAGPNGTAGGAAGGYAGADGTTGTGTIGADGSCVCGAVGNTSLLELGPEWDSAGLWELRPPLVPRAQRSRLSLTELATDGRSGVAQGGAAVSDSLDAEVAARSLLLAGHRLCLCPRA